MKVSEDLEIMFTREVLAAMVKCAFIDAKHVSENTDPDITNPQFANKHPEDVLAFVKGGAK